MFLCGRDQLIFGGGGWRFLPVNDIFFSRKCEQIFLLQNDWFQVFSESDITYPGENWFVFFSQKNIPQIINWSLPFHKLRLLCTHGRKRESRFHGYHFSEYNCLGCLPVLRIAPTPLLPGVCLPRPHVPSPPV